MSLMPAPLPDDVPALQAIVRRQMAELERLQRERKKVPEELALTREDLRRRAKIARED